MEPDYESLRQQLGEYYVYYYAELRRLLSITPAYRSDPEAFPYHLRDHARLIAMAECADGYAVIHYAAPEGKRGVSTPESFQLDSDKRNMRMSELTPKNLPSHDDFLVSDAFVVTNDSGQYIETVGGKEKIDFVSLGQIPYLTPDKARADVQKEVRDFFNDPDSPFFGSR